MKQTKNFLLIASFITIAILLYLQKCGRGGGTTETIKYDTVWVHEKKDTQYIPTIVNHYLPGKVPPALEKWDTLYVIEDIDTAAILQDYFSFNLYSDTLKNKYGYVLVNDTISRNKILGRGVKTDLLVPEVTKTITLIEKRNQVYFGGGIWGNTKDALSGVELNLSLKTKSNRIIGIGYQNLFDYGNFYKIEYRHLITLKKK